MSRKQEYGTIERLARVLVIIQEHPVFTVNLVYAILEDTNNHPTLTEQRMVLRDIRGLARLGFEITEESRPITFRFWGWRPGEVVGNAIRFRADATEE